MDLNLYKQKIYCWLQEHAQRKSRSELEAYCYQQIPTSEHYRLRWLVEQTLYWYDYWIQFEAGPAAR